jgi:hypothetical protein
MSGRSSTTSTPTAGSTSQPYTTLRPGPEFGYPLRPLGFLEQGIAARWMQSAPWVSHLLSVVNHAVVALVFVWVLRAPCRARQAVGGRCSSSRR